MIGRSVAYPFSFNGLSALIFLLIIILGSVKFVPFLSLSYLISIIYFLWFYFVLVTMVIIYLNMELWDSIKH